MPFTKDVIIVGGGISGLYTAYRICSQSPEKTVLLLESSDELGGRIRTQYDKDFQIEKGAARFSESHHRLLGLIDELGFSEEKIEIPNKTTFIYQGKPCQYNLSEKLKTIVQSSKDIPKQQLQKITFYQLCVLVYDTTEADKMKAAFAYDAEFIRLNAHACLKMFRGDLLGESKYFVLKCGLSSIIQKMKECIDASDNVEIRYNQTVTDVKDKRVFVKQGDDTTKYSALHIVCAIPYLALRQLPYFKDVQEIHSVKPISLCRIYAKYPVTNGKSWFHDLEKTATDNYLRYIIPINMKQGIIMYYSDLYIADMWRNWSNVSDEILIQMIHKELQILFPSKTIPKPTKIQTCHWKTGVHAWRPNFDFEEMSRKMIQPTHDHVYVIGESYSRNQDWIEGCLETSDRFLRKLLGGNKKRTLKKRQ